MGGRTSWIADKGCFPALLVIAGAVSTAIGSLGVAVGGFMS